MSKVMPISQGSDVITTQPQPPVPPGPPVAQGIYFYPHPFIANRLMFNIA